MAETCWQFITGSALSEEIGCFAGERLDLKSIDFDTSCAHLDGSKTRYVASRNVVILGADAYPSEFESDNSNERMSLHACLSHELAHAERYQIGFRRPFSDPDSFLDEAETSIHASFRPELRPIDREDLIGDASLRLKDYQNNGGINED